MNVQSLIDTTSKIYFDNVFKKVNKKILDNAKKNVSLTLFQLPIIDLLFPPYVESIKCLQRIHLINTYFDNVYSKSEQRFFLDYARNKCMLKV